MKRVIHKIVHWLNLSIITLMLILVIVLGLLHFVSYRFPVYRDNFEQFISNLVRQPVRIDALVLGSRGLEPVLILRNVIILDDTKTKTILRASELRVGIDLIGSILKWQIKPGLLLLRGSKFSIVQDKNGKFNIGGMPGFSAENNGNREPSHIVSWLFEQSRIDLENIDLDISLVSGENLKLRDLYLKLYNGVLQHRLLLRGKLLQKTTAAFQVNLKIHGDVLSQTSFPLNGSVTFENWFPNLDNLEIASGGSLVPQSGDVTFLIKNSRVATKIFRTPLAINKMSGRAIWQHTGDDFKLNIQELNFEDNWLSFSGDSKFLFADPLKLPTVDIQLQIKLSNLAKAKLYYPVALLPPKATKWLDQAFTKSKKITGTVILQGPLDKFPFDHNEGKFVADTIIRNVYLHYDGEWPEIQKITGKMIFAGRTMTIMSNSAKILNEPIKSVKVTIPDLDLPMLYVDGAIDTDAKVGLDFVRACPLKNTIGRKLQDINLSGPMKFNLTMKIPLSDDLPDQEVHTAGSINLKNSHISSSDFGFDVNNLQGDLSFKNGNLKADNLYGDLFSKRVALSVSTLHPEREDSITTVNLAGQASIQDFERAFAVKLSHYANGNFNYKGELALHGVASAQNIFNLNSNLQGVAIDLPDPFAKKSQDISKFNLTSWFGGNKLPHVAINYNNQIQASLMVKKDSANGLQIMGGEIKFGNKPAQAHSTNGLVVSGSFDKISWPVWQEFFKKIRFEAQGAGSIVKQIGLTIRELYILGQVFNNVSLMLKPYAGGWETGFTLPDIVGKLYIPSDAQATMRGEFQKLHFKSDRQKTLSEIKPQDLPPLNIKIANLDYDGMRFDKVAFVTEKQSGGIKISKVTVNDPLFSIEASGEWLFANGNHSSGFKGKLISNNLGGLLKKWDLTDAMVGGRSTVNFVLKWPGYPYQPQAKIMSGGFSIAAREGKIINLSKGTEAKLGFGRVLGILSLQSLPRRLTLDFSDLTHQGYMFDTLAGNFDLGKGNITVKNLHLEGPAADIKAYGRIGLDKQDYDLKISAVPQITSSIPVAAAIAGGPVVGIVTLVADRLISAAIKKSAIYTYHITGLWTKPDVSVAKAQQQVTQKSE